MIQQTHRFHGRAGLRRVQSNSQVVRGGTFALRYAPSNRRAGYRVAVVVSKKISKSAVVRNRIRRRIYENVRILFASDSIAYDVIVIVYSDSLATMEANQLRKELWRTLRKAGLITADTPSRAIVEH